MRIRKDLLPPPAIRTRSVRVRKAGASVSVSLPGITSHRPGSQVSDFRAREAHSQRSTPATGYPHAERAGYYSGLLYFPAVCGSGLGAANERSNCPLSTSHTNRVLSCPPETASRPSGLVAAAYMKSAAPA